MSKQQNIPKSNGFIGIVNTDDLFYYALQVDEYVRIRCNLCNKLLSNVHLLDGEEEDEEKGLGRDYPDALCSSCFDIVKKYRESEEYKNIRIKARTNN